LSLLQAFRSVLGTDAHTTEGDLTALFMKIDANANGGVDWDEFTSFMLTLDEGTTAMAAAATMLDLVLDEPFEKRRDSLVCTHLSVSHHTVHV
jgi:hypothetical protein